MKNHTAGKFCGSCAKAVIDFTKLSDNEIIRILENANGQSLCGRFDSDQLNKIIVQTNAERNNPILYKMLAGLLLLASVETASAQSAPKPDDSVSVSKSLRGIVGKVAYSDPVKGKVTDSDGKPLSNVTIYLERTNNNVKTQIDGTFEIGAHIGDVLKIRNEGFLDMTIKVTTFHITIQMRLEANNQINKEATLKNTDERLIILGGISSHNVTAEPLYIVDGIVVDEDEFRSIKAENIKSINVLKGAAAKAVYGTRGTNGAILIYLYSKKEMKKRQKQK